MPAARWRQGRTWTRPQWKHRSHAAEFSKTVRPLGGGDSSPERAAAAPAGRRARHGLRVRRAGAAQKRPARRDAPALATPGRRRPSRRARRRAQARRLPTWSTRRRAPRRAGPAASRRAARRRASPRPGEQPPRLGARDRRRRSAISGRQVDARPSPGSVASISSGQLALHVQAVEAPPRPAPRPRRVEARTSARAIARLASRGGRGVERLVEQQLVVDRHRLVGDPHQLAEHLLRRLGHRPRSCRATWTSSGRRRCPAGSAW